MNPRKITEEMEDALWELVPLRTSHHSDDLALQLVDGAAPEPLDEGQRRQELQKFFRRLWRNRPSGRGEGVCRWKEYAE